MEDILSFREKKYRFLSNMFRIPIPVIFNNISFFSVENAYVAGKTTNSHLQRAIADMKPGASKAFGKIIFQEKLWINTDWNDEFRLRLMRDLVLQKFTKNAHLRLALLDTGSGRLVEGNNWHDNFFGVCHCGNCPLENNQLDPHNHLGNILMETRGKLHKTG